MAGKGTLFEEVLVWAKMLKLNIRVSKPNRV